MKHRIHPYLLSLLLALRDVWYAVENPRQAERRDWFVQLIKRKNGGSYDT